MMIDQTEKTIEVLGLGSPIVDALIHVEESFIEQIDGAKGGMEMVDAETIEGVIADSGQTPALVSGGSAGNTIFALATLGHSVSILGKLGNDEHGHYYRQALLDAGGDDTRFKVDQSPNAKCLSMITPDSERTMRTFLGAAANLTVDDISVEDFKGVRIAHVEGYLLFNQELTRHVLESAKEAGCLISLDLASFEVVGAAGSMLKELLSDYVDIVFANEDEARAYFGDDADTDYEKMALALAEQVQIAAVKLGKEGALIASGGQVHRVEPRVVENAIDTTGAGDLWASGFLHGWLNDRSLAECGAFGSVMGAEIVQVLGASIPSERWPEIKAELSV
ncbi:MAG: adenosine kinase [Verrucomicrobiota bacterium]